MRDADDDRLLLPFQREQEQSATWKKNLRRRRNRKFFSLFAVVSFVVFLSISFWFTEEGTQNMEKVFEREDFKRFREGSEKCERTDSSARGENE